MSKRKVGYPSIDDVQRRVANISIGASTLRNQGDSGVAGAARGFLVKLPLARLSEKTERQFNKWLNRETLRLSKQFKGGAKNNWGAARKAINIFLENAFYDRFLSEEYGLQKLEDMLEIPLDSNVAKGLKKDWKTYLKKHKIDPDSYKLPQWESIKGLRVEDSDEFQACAHKVAKSEPNYRYRIYLDLKYWRPKD